MADIPTGASEIVAPPAQPQSPEATVAGLAEGFSTRAETLLGDRQARTLAPSYFIEAAAILIQTLLKNSFYLAAVAYNTGNMQQYRQLVAYRDAAEQQYHTFMTKYNFPQEANHEPAQTEIDIAVASYRASVTAHPEIMEYAKGRDEAAVTSWLQKSSASRRGGSELRRTLTKDEEEKRKKADQAAIEAIKEELEQAGSATS